MADYVVQRADSRIVRGALIYAPIHILGEVYGEMFVQATVYLKRELNHAIRYKAVLLALYDEYMNYGVLKM